MGMVRLWVIFLDFSLEPAGFEEPGFAWSVAAAETESVERGGNSSP